MFPEVGLRLVYAAIGAVISFFTTLALAWWWQHRKFRQQRQRLHALEKTTGAREVALLLSAREEIRQAALDYLESIGRSDLPLFVVHRPGLLSNDEEEWFRYFDEIKAAVRQIREQGANRIYLFLNVPLALAVFAGATLANGPAVVMHHYFNGTYHPIGHLAQDTLKL